MKICIEVRDVSDKIYFTQAVSSGVYKGEKIAISSTIPGQIAFVSFRGKTWKVDLDEIATVIMGQVIKEGEKQ